jgi:hypothetical protein
MNFLTRSEAFSKCQTIIDTLIMRERHLPEQVFKSPLSLFVFINSDEIFHTVSFFQRIKSFLSQIEESRLFLAVIEPDPKDYFFHHFGKYSIVEMSVEDTNDDYLRIAQEDPGNSPADAIGFNSRVVLLFSSSGRWAIYVDRDYELGIVGFADKELLKLFASLYGSNNVFDVNQAVEQILKMVYRNRDSEIPPKFRRQLIANYSSIES